MFKFQLFVLGFLVFSAVSAFYYDDDNGYSGFESQSESPYPCDIGFSCYNHASGRYALGCTEQYVICVSQTTYCLRCPSHRYYEPTVDRCVDKNHCSMCDHSAIMNNEVSETMSTPSSDLSGLENQGSMFSCADNADGMYPLGCSTEFASCTSGLLEVFSCSGKLKFDPVTKECVDESKVLLCTQSTTASSSTMRFITVASTTTSAPSRNVTSLCNDRFSCIKHPFGRYALGCSNVFVACVSQVAYCLTCPPGLVFEQRLNRCVVISVSSLCKSTTTVAPTTLMTTSVTPSVISCLGQPNGMLAIGCSSKFAVCMDGSLHILRCPNQLKFDPISQQCLVEIFVLICGGRQTTTTTTTTTTSPTTVSRRTTLHTRATTQPTTCTYTGVIAVHTCSRYYSRCIRGQSVYFHCSPGYIFDSRRSFCVEKNLVDCGI